MKWRPGDPRFVVRECEGFEAWASGRQFLSVSVLDAAYNFAEVARFNQENVRLYHRSDDGKRNLGEANVTQKREALRDRAAGLAAILEAEHA